MVEVKVIEPFKYGGKTLEVGDTVDLPDSAAESAVEKGYAEKTDGREEIPEVGEPGSVDVGDYMNSGGWLTAEEVEEGGRITIKGDAHFDDRFEQRYLVVAVAYGGSEYNLRVGKRNTRRISKEFGTDAAEWAGRKVEVAAIQEYEGVNAKGMILKPVAEE